MPGGFAQHALARRPSSGTLTTCAGRDQPSSPPGSCPTLGLGSPIRWSLQLPQGPADAGACQPLDAAGPRGSGTRRGWCGRAAGAGRGTAAEFLVADGRWDFRCPSSHCHLPQALNIASRAARPDTGVTGTPENPFPAPAAVGAGWVGRGWLGVGGARSPGCLTHTHTHTRTRMCGAVAGPRPPVPLGW